MATMKRGDLKPDLEITISDARASADFSTVAASACRIIGEMDGVVVLNDTADTITVAADNKSATVKRAWAAGETDTAGRLWLAVEVDWGAGAPQTFPRAGSLYLDIERDLGDA